MLQPEDGGMPLIDSSRPQAAGPRLTGSVFIAAALLALSASSAHSPVPPANSHPFLVHGQRLALGLPPVRGEEAGETEGRERERLIQWLESRHRAAPGVDWQAIEAANLLANLSRVADLARTSAKAVQPTWRERGPLNQTGATALTAIQPDGKSLLIATSQGGIFGGVPGTQAWKRFTDGLGGYLQGFAVSSKPEMWVAAVSGLTDGRVYVSRNRGATWSAPQGLPPLSDVYEMIQDGGDRRTIYLLAQARLEEGDTAPILARSRNGGLSFSVVYTGAGVEKPGIWTSRIGAGPLYLMSEGQLWISSDQGSSFFPLGVVTSKSNNFAVLRGSEAGAPTLYAAMGRGAFPDTLYVSEDGGHNWEARFRFEGFSYPLSVLYGGSMTASMHDPNLVLFGNQHGMRSTDGGRTFQGINRWEEYYPNPADRLHADVNGLQFALYRGQEVLFLNTDGGSYVSTDGGLSVQNITQLGLPSAQLYSTWSSSSNPDLFLAGSQDQGLQLSLPPERAGRPGAPLTNAQLISGDYSGLTSASHDMTDVFAVYPTTSSAPGLLLLFRPHEPNPPRRGEPAELIRTTVPQMSHSGFFVTSAADPDDPATVYLAGDRIWTMRYLGDGNFSQTVMPQSFSPDDRDYISALAVAPADHDVWYVATFEGHLWYSRNHGATWTESATTREQLPFNSSSTLVVSTDDPLTCFAGGSGYGSPPVLVTRDGGETWSDLSQGLPPTVVWSLAFDSPATQTLYAATEAGPFVFNAAAGSWRSLLGGGSPIGRYYTVEGVPAAHLVRFGTFSRGVWDYIPPPRR
jgi:photosystem II stability/assembly factor-like uncharacterized protein